MLFTPDKFLVAFRSAPRHLHVCTRKFRPCILAAKWLTCSAMNSLPSLLWISRFWPLPVLSPPLSQLSTSQWLVHCHFSFRCLQILVSYGSSFCFPIVPFSSLKKKYKIALTLYCAVIVSMQRVLRAKACTGSPSPLTFPYQICGEPTVRAVAREKCKRVILASSVWLCLCPKAIEDMESGELSTRRGCYLMGRGAWTHTWNALFSHVGLDYKSYLFLGVCGEHAWWCRWNVYFAVRWLCYLVCSIKCFLIWERSLDC